MKTTLVSLLTALLLGSAAVASGRHLDAADFIAIAFTTGLVAWTVVQYRTVPKALTTAKPLHLPIRPVSVPAPRITLTQQAA